jgi:DNA helicase II / ATP-dependent DNA helicase PcrA
MMDYFSFKLEQIKEDKDQYAAFLSNASTVVRAGPGSGKTTVLTLKIMQLLNEKIKVPRGLACITYSNEAAREFKKRLKLFGLQKRPNIILDTVHSFCISEIIIPFVHLYEREFPLPLNLISNNDRSALFNQILKDMDIDKKSLKIEAMDKERNESVSGESIVEMDSNPIAKAVAKEFEKRLKEKNQVDFVEIVKCATKIIREQEFVRKILEAKFPWILIDEYQDLGKPLHEMILTLFTRTNIKIFAVGDPDQSIYGFQGAHPDYLLELYDIPNIVSIDLKTNYRSNQDIIDASSIALNLDDRNYQAGTRLGEQAEFHFITCEDEIFAQFEYVITRIIPECLEKGIPLEEICVLVSNGEQVKELNQLMNDADIPNYLAKHELMKSKVLVWLKDCAMWVNKPKNISFSEISDFWISLLSLSHGGISEAEKTNKKRILYSVLGESKKFHDNLYHWTSFIFSALNLLEVLHSIPRYATEKDAVMKFFTDCENGKYREYHLEKFSAIGKPVNQVTISTRHSSKGLEFEVVVLLGMEEGNFPYFSTINNQKAFNEQRRLFFVCLSRAKSICYLLRSKRITTKTRYGPKTWNKAPSMFWMELDESIKNERKAFKHQ